jgi:hypothetical protein
MSDLSLRRSQNSSTNSCNNKQLVEIEIRLASVKLIHPHTSSTFNNAMSRDGYETSIS